MRILTRVAILPTPLTMQINGKTIRKVEYIIIQIKYLRVMLTRDGATDNKVKERIIETSRLLDDRKVPSKTLYRSYNILSQK